MTRHDFEPKPTRHDMLPVLVSMLFFLTQHGHRLDARCTPRRDDACGGTGKEKHKNDGGKNQWIPRIHLEQRDFQHPGESNRQRQPQHDAKAQLE